MGGRPGRRVLRRVLKEKESRKLYKSKVSTCWQAIVLTGTVWRVLVIGHSRVKIGELLVWSWSSKTEELGDWTAARE